MNLSSTWCSSLSSKLSASKQQQRKHLINFQKIYLVDEVFFFDGLHNPQVFLAFSFFLHNQVHNENYTHEDYIWRWIILTKTTYTLLNLKFLCTQTLNVFGHTKWWTFILPCSSHHPQTLGNVLLLQLFDMRNKNPYYKYFIEIWRLSLVLWKSNFSISFPPSNFSISFIDALKKINSMS